MTCPHCGARITVNDATVMTPGPVNPAAANPLQVVIYPNTNACAAPPPIVWYPVLMS